MRYDFSNPTNEMVKGTKRLYILGLSTDGPSFEPVHIPYHNRAKEIFGSGNLIQAYEEASLVEDIDIYLVRISGTEARGQVVVGQEVVLNIRSTFSGEKYNNMYVKLLSNWKGIDELRLYNSKDEELKRYKLDETVTMRDLVDLVNKDNQKLYDKKIILGTDIPEKELRSVLKRDYKLAETQGGKDETKLSKNELYFALERAYSVLQGQHIDVICPYMARFDDAHPQFFYGSEDSKYGEAYYSSGDFLSLVEDNNSKLYATFYEQLIDFCKSQEESGRQTHGVIGIREVKEIEDVGFHYLGRLSRANGLRERYGLTDFDGNMIDKGYYISIMGQELTMDGRRFNGCAVYAAMVTSLEIKENLTMKSLPNEVELAYQLAPQEVADLSYLGVVVARNSVKYGPVIANSVTAGLSESPLHSLINVRMVQSTFRLINSLLDELIGSPIVDGVTEKEIEKRLAESFKFLEREGVVKEYSYQIAYLDGGENIEIYIEMTPRNATESISVSTGINVTGGNL